MIRSARSTNRSIVACVSRSSGGNASHQLLTALRSAAAWLKNVAEVSSWRDSMIVVRAATTAVVTAIQIWANMGVTMVIFLAGLQTIPEELHEAARIDGASRRQTFWHVTWPLLTPVVNTNLILCIIGSLQAWQLFLVLTGYRAGTQVMGYVVFAQAFGQTSGSTTSNSFRQGYGAAASVVLFVLVFVIGMTATWLLRRREARLLG